MPSTTGEPALISKQSVRSPMLTAHRLQLQSGNQVRLRLVIVLSSTLLLAGCGLLGDDDDDDDSEATTTTLLGPTTTVRDTTTTFPTGTTSTTIFGTTTTTLQGPTTTVDGGPQDTCPAGSNPTCKATFRLKSIVTLGGLQFNVSYGTVTGCFKGIGSDVQCNVAQGIEALGTFNDDDDRKRLSLGLISIAGIEGPTNVAVCNFIGTGTPNPTRFRIDVVDAVEPDLTPAAAVLGVTFDCAGGGPTTTTAPGPTTTTTTSTTLPVAANEFDITLRLADDVTIGGLQIVLDYAQAPGEIRGSGAILGEGGTLECQSLVSGALAQFNDDDAGNVTMGFVSITGFNGPVDLARCVFDRDTLGTVSHDDFVISVDDATTPDVEPVLPRPAVRVSRIVPR